MVDRTTTRYHGDMTPQGTTRVGVMTTTRYHEVQRYHKVPKSANFDGGTTWGPIDPPRGTYKQALGNTTSRCALFASRYLEVTLKPNLVP